MSRSIEVEFVNTSCTYVRGGGSRELLTELRGRPPVWGTRARAWVTSPHTARDVIAVAESRGYEVIITEQIMVSPNEQILVSDERPDPGRGLW